MQKPTFRYPIDKHSVRHYTYVGFCIYTLATNNESIQYCKLIMVIHFIFLQRAERFFIEAGLHKQAVEMYNAAEKWQDAHRVKSSCRSVIKSFLFHNLALGFIRILERR